MINNHHEKYSAFLQNETATIELSAILATICCNSATVIYLYGSLGSGKTTFSRGFLHKLGYQGNVKSPTYTLVEHYELALINVYHFDLYRLSHPEELEFIGVRDYFDHNAIHLIEWPQQGEGFLPQPDISLHLSYKNKGRYAKIISYTIHGGCILKKFKGATRLLYACLS
ncbi:tRNA threonylcarbamoyladenosine biosynthesis protein TsaE [Candidatus Profftia tarda]|uniref:tRNA threonylcarbamoyladenosine biosynthesis protein TsaE n=1 Tax=Candidatus Profftia tarda TaxID=1177216 RepID=A0A8E4GHV8_9ENTR|nr:tRNA (adenosine(37)-N6)-threonylcarbamoyltransferase complex ATPase subunit type 1 TsaE [Candidatus Profftia tarda]CAD6511414.1 tRNA threonylcarbamoyladenosine biosynthesis protein TsaE [Candidatus Profftia tarda]